MLRALAAAGLLLALVASGASARGRAPVDRLRLVEVVDGLRQPVGLAVPPGPGSRLYVVQQGGLIRVVEHGRILARPYLDLRSQVWYKDLAGLLAIAFDPAFSRTHRLVVDYVGRDRAVHIVEYRGNRTRAFPTSAQDIATVEEPAPVDPGGHFGGGLAFEPDGRLLVGFGDGEDDTAAQDPDTLLGKLVRYDLDAAAPEPEILGYGFRNPWRLSEDRVTGDVYVGDVGDNRWEEVDFVRHGTAWPLNFGWPRFEGRARHSDTPLAPGAPGTLHMPLLVYRHVPKRCSAVVGGVVYRGHDIPSLRGRYVFADFCSGRVMSVRAGGGSTATRFEVQVPSLISSFGVDGRGELYVVPYSYGTSRLYRLAPATTS